MKPISLIDLEFYLGCKSTKDLIPIYYYEVFDKKYYAKTLYVGHISNNRIFEPDNMDTVWALHDENAWYRSFPYGVEYDPTTKTFGDVQKLPYYEGEIDRAGKHVRLWFKDPDEHKAKQLLSDYYEAKLKKVNKRRGKLLAILAELE